MRHFHSSELFTKQNFYLSPLSFEKSNSCLYSPLCQFGTAGRCAPERPIMSKRKQINFLLLLNAFFYILSFTPFFHAKISDLGGRGAKVGGHGSSKNRRAWLSEFDVAGAPERTTMRKLAHRSSRIRRARSNRNRRARLWRCAKVGGHGRANLTPRQNSHGRRIGSTHRSSQSRRPWMSE